VSKKMKSEFERVVGIAWGDAEISMRSLWSESWKSSRDSIVIKLAPPKEFDVSAEESLDMDPDEYEAEEACHGAEWSAYSRAKKAIEAAGLKVKP